MPASEGNSNVVSAPGAPRYPDPAWSSQGRLPREVKLNRQVVGTLLGEEGRVRAKTQRFSGAGTWSGRPALATEPRPTFLEGLPLISPSLTLATPRARH